MDENSFLALGSMVNFMPICLARPYLVKKSTTNLHRTIGMPRVLEISSAVRGVWSVARYSSVSSSMWVNATGFCLLEGRLKAVRTCGAMQE